MQAPKKNMPTVDDREPYHTEEINEPTPGTVSDPDANVASDGHCIVPAYAEATRIDTGDACEDGRDAK